jgi:sugar phosphate isomerase/epimerase
MRLGAPLEGKWAGPEEWVEALSAKGYRAAYCPLSPKADEREINAYAQAARLGDVVIAETGAWSNPLSRDSRERAKALQTCKEQLLLAERIGARCCVNIAGSRGAKWDGPCREDLSEETFEMIVQSVREIIDAVRPKNTFYTLETMPWMYPDSADSYLRLLRAIDRKQFGVHFDIVNLINCPERYFNTAGVARDFVAKLGPHIRSCHLKDIQLGDQLTVHLEEVRLGLGGLDHSGILHAYQRLDPDLPVMLEHLSNPNDYDLAADFIRDVAKKEALQL